ncbi:MAG: type II toxin-antitoxin system PrlF family antitoxin [Longimicrobiaceae bacterium]
MSDATECSGEDATVEAFLQFLETDLATHPERLHGMPQGLYERLLAVTDGLEVNPDDPIDGPVAL